MSDRDYRITRSSRPILRDPFTYSQPDRRQTPLRDYHDDYASHRSSRDIISPRTSEAPSATKTTYKVSSTRESEPYVTRGNVIVLDSRLDRDRELSDWEVIRPERSESGAYVIETSSISDSSTPARRRDDYSDRYERSRRDDVDVEFLSPPRIRRERSLSRGTIEAMRSVRVTEDSSDDEDRRSTRSRRTARSARRSEVDIGVVGAPLTRTMSSLRHDHSPESVTRRRSRSIGFFKDQISHHDATECKHERPGAEASNAGKYLIDHRGERVRRGHDDDVSEVSGYRVRKGKSEIDTYGAEVRRRRERGGREVEYYEEDEVEERSAPYEPQRGSRRHGRRHGRERERERDRGREDDEVSEYYEKKVRKYH